MSEVVLDAAGTPVLLEMAPDASVEGRAVDSELEAHLLSQCRGVQSATLSAPDQVAYDQRMGLTSKKYLTMIRHSDAAWILERLRDQIAGKVVVEIGAGIGTLAVALAAHAKRVFAIEADPMWSWVFARFLYKSKPANLTYMLDTAQNLVDVIRGDIAIVVTGSAERELRDLAGRFAPTVIMPWQDWNGGVAIARSWGVGHAP